MGGPSLACSAANWTLVVGQTPGRRPVLFRGAGMLGRSVKLRQEPQKTGRGG